MAPTSRESALFSSLPPWKTPWSDLVLSYGLQAVIVAIFVWIPILHPEILERPKPDYHAVQLVATPVPVNHEPQKLLRRPVLEAKLDPPPETLRLPAPRPVVKPKVEEAPQVKIATKKLEPLPPSTAPVIPKKPVMTNVFSTGSSATQTIDRAPQKVQTGGFGDPNGVPAKASQNKAVNIAQSGGFDMPTGPGYGNGTGGAKGARGVIASTGFGNGVATGTAPAYSKGTVRQAGFGDAAVPVPIYTEEARAKRIEGEVLLEVVLEASGRLRVLKVVRGLGHGLDDAAVRAAEQIQFKPALKDGQPSDSTAVLHIIFQLA